MIYFEVALCALQYVIWLDMNVFKPMLLLKTLVQIDKLACIMVQSSSQELLVSPFVLRNSTDVLVLLIGVHLRGYPSEIADEVGRDSLPDAYIVIGFDRGWGW